MQPTIRQTADILFSISYFWWPVSCCHLKLYQSIWFLSRYEKWLPHEMTKMLVNKVYSPLLGAGSRTFPGKSADDLFTLISWIITWISCQNAVHSQSLEKRTDSSSSGQVRKRQKRYLSYMDYFISHPFFLYHQRLFFKKENELNAVANVANSSASRDKSLK